MSPLHWAALGGHESTVRVLLTSGADVNALDNVNDKPYL